jgi:hypothetical protein
LVEGRGQQRLRGERRIDYPAAGRPCLNGLPIPP